MARIRSIKPEFFTSLSVATLTLRARLTWIGLWTHVDDEGRCPDNPRLIAAAVWPLDDDVDPRCVEDDLAELETAGRIERYRVDGKAYLEVANWSEHQHPNRPQRSKYPGPPPVGPDSSNEHGPRSDASVRAHAVDNSHRGPPTTSSQVSPHSDGSVNAHGAPTPGGGGGGGEGEGRGEGEVTAPPADEVAGTDLVAAPQRPPEQCLRHLGTDDDAPCRKCQRAREDAEDWDRQNRSDQQRVSAAQERLIRDCPDCHGSRRVEGPDGHPTRRRCHHPQVLGHAAGQDTWRRSGQPVGAAS